eukprot:8732-Eustigmatos_ZCMA.PRE.1
MYAPFESGMKSGTARVYDHEIPGGQFSNLMVQCQAMGIWHRWEEVSYITYVFRGVGFAQLIVVVGMSSWEISASDSV